MLVNRWLLASTETCDYFTPFLGLYEKTNKEGTVNSSKFIVSVGSSLPHLHLNNLNYYHQNSYVPNLFNDFVRNSPFRMYSVHKEPTFSSFKQKLDNPLIGQGR